MRSANRQFASLGADSPAGVQTPAIVTRGIASFGDDFVNLDFTNVRLTSILSATVLNEARFQYGRDNGSQIPQPAAPGEPTTAPEGRSPSVSLTGGVTFGTPNFLPRAAFPNETRYQFADTMTITRGNHTLKFGFDINRVNDVLDNLFDVNGAYSYKNINDFIIDDVNSRSSIPTVSCVSSTRTAGDHCLFRLTIHRRGRQQLNRFKRWRSSRAVHYPKRLSGAFTGKC